MITLTNDFHGTTAKVRIEYFQFLSRHQEYRLRSQLCPYVNRRKCNCYCGVLGQRGPNNPIVTFGPRPLLPVILLQNHDQPEEIMSISSGASLYYFDGIPE